VHAPATHAWFAQHTGPHGVPPPSQVTLAFASSTFASSAIDDVSCAFALASSWVIVSVASEPPSHSPPLH